MISVIRLVLIWSMRIWNKTRTKAFVYLEVVIGNKKSDRNTNIDASSLHASACTAKFELILSALSSPSSFASFGARRVIKPYSRNRKAGLSEIFAIIAVLKLKNP